MRFKVVISNGEDGWLVVECPSLPGCVSQGRTVEEALENIKDAIQGCLDVLCDGKDGEGLGLTARLPSFPELRRREKVSLDDVIAEIGEHVSENADSTEIIREMRDRAYRD